MFLVRPHIIIDILPKNKLAHIALFLPSELLRKGNINTDRVFPKKKMDWLKPIKYDLSQKSSKSLVTESALRDNSTSL